MLTLPAKWQTALASDFPESRCRELAMHLAEERKKYIVYPADEDILKALQLTPPDKVKIVLLGQDPYHEAHQAHGLAFSVPETQKIPPSLRNIYKELAEEYHWSTLPGTGNLENWAKQGVLLLNTVLSVRAQAAGSHRNFGWEPLTDAIIRAVDAQRQPTVFMLLGSFAQSKRQLIQGKHHRVLEAAHPSPLSAYRGFFHSNIFRQANDFLQANDRTPIDWLQISGNME